MTTRTWKVYGAEGHRQRESFNDSYSHDWTEGENVRKIEVENSDKTGTNEYSIIRITRNTSDECERELEGQISDGIFENSRVGEVIEVKTMNKTLEKAMEIMNLADDCYKQQLPELEIGDTCTISDVWDGEGEEPDGSYCYQITDSGEDGDSNVDVYINYEWEVVEEKEDFLDTAIRITGIELI